MVKKTMKKGAVKAQQVRSQLQQYTIGIAGLGGLGSNVAVSLVRAGIGGLVLVDFDRVDESNLNRQHYFLSHLGQKKTEALTSILQSINPHCTITTNDTKLTPGAMDLPFKSADVIIEALDDAAMKTAFIEEIQQKLPHTPLVSASGVSGYGHIDRIQIKKMGTLTIVYDQDAKDVEDDILVAPRVNLIAQWQANIAIEVLLGEHQ